MAKTSLINRLQLFKQKFAMQSDEQFLLLETINHLKAQDNRILSLTTSNTDLNKNNRKMQNRINKAIDTIDDAIDWH